MHAHHRHPHHASAKAAPLFDPEQLESLLQVVAWHRADHFGAVDESQLECFQRVFRVLNREKIVETVVTKVSGPCLRPLCFIMFIIWPCIIGASLHRRTHTSRSKYKCATIIPSNTLWNLAGSTNFPCSPSSTLSHCQGGLKGFVPKAPGASVTLRVPDPTKLCGIKVDIAVHTCIQFYLHSLALAHCINASNLHSHLHSHRTKPHTHSYTQNRAHSHGHTRTAAPTQARPSNSHALDAVAPVL